MSLDENSEDEDYEARGKVAWKVTAAGVGGKHALGKVERFTRAWGSLSPGLAKATTTCAE